MTSPFLTSKLGNMLLFLVQVLLAIPTSVSTTLSTKLTSSTIPSSNFTVPKHSLAMIPCKIDNNDNFAAHCFCYEDVIGKYAVDRHWLIEAITLACHEMTNGIGEPVKTYGFAPGLTQTFAHTYDYAPTRDTEEGRIVSTLHINTFDPACAGPRPLGWDECWNTFHAPIDSCDTDGENGKNCGIYLKDCLFWVLDPAPSVNQPYPYDLLD